MSDFSADLAVVIGIDDYDEAVGRLQTPVRDAEAVARALEGRFGYRVILLRNGEASRERLLDLLKNGLPPQLGERSRLLFYFAGHGVAQDSAQLEGPRGYLVPQDATPKVTTHLPMNDVREALAGLPCRHLLVVLDCCFSGSFHWEGRRPLHVPGELLYEERYRHWVRHPARWVLASAAHDEYALDVADRRRGQEDGHSPFAAALLDGLAGEADRFPEGGDGVITLAELYAYVLDRLSPHQSPVLAPLKGQTRGEFVFRDPRQPLALRSAEAEVKLDSEANPYRGLESYKTEHEKLFFGRGDATRLLRSHVEAHALSVVVGPSGSGKSSLVHAGLLPCLRQETQLVWVAPPPFRVAGDPFVALRDALIAASSPLAVTEDLKEPGKAEAWVAAWTTAHPAKRLLLVVDQAEELVTRVPRSGSEKEPDSLPEESARFLACLAALIRGGGGRVRAVVVVRSDYETDLDDGPHSSLWKDGRFVVPPLRREDLREIIEGPAASRALYFDDPRLVDRLVDEVWGMPGGLPLLSYALSRLFLAYVKEARGDRLLTARDLQAIGAEPGGEDDGAVAPGGIVRVLRDGADKAVAALPGEAYRKTLWRVLLRMVNLAGARATRRQVPTNELIYPEEAENQRVTRVLEQLVDKARLLVSDRNGDRDLIEPAHDELLVAWPELVRRIDDARVHLPVHRRLTEAATEWSAPAAQAPEGRRGQPDLDLRLLGLVETSGLPEAWFNKSEAAYISAARRARWRRTALRWTASVGTLLVVTGAALFFRDQSQRNERLRYQSNIQGLLNQGDADLGDRRPARALLLARQAFMFLGRSRGDGASSVDHAVSQALDRLTSQTTGADFTAQVDQLFRRILDDLPPNRVLLRNQEDDPGPVAFHPSGRLLAAGHDKTLVLVTLPQYGIEGTGPPRPLPGAPQEALAQIAFSTDGRLLAAGYAAGSLCVWRLAGMPPAPVKRAFACAPDTMGDVSGLAFRPSTNTLVVGRQNEGAGSVQVWEVADGLNGKPELKLSSERPLTGAVRDLTVSAAGEMFVAVTDPSQRLRGSVEDAAAPLQPLGPANSGVESLGVDSSGRQIVGSLLRSGTALISKLPAGGIPDLSGVGSWPRGASLTVSDDGTIHRFQSLCESSLTELATDQGLDRIATACDGVLRLWDLRPAHEVWSRGIGRWRLNSSEVTTFLSRGGPGSRLAVGKASGDVEVYDLKTGNRWSSRRPLFAEGDSLSSPPGTGCDGVAASAVAWNAGDKSLHVLGRDGLWRTDTVTGGKLSHRLNGCVCAAAGSADGAWMAVLLQKSPGETDLVVVSTSGSRKQEVLTSRLTAAGWCDIGLAFHPDRTELAAGIGREITLWTPTPGGRWRSRKLDEAGGRITAAVWAGDLLAVGGEALPSGNGFVEAFDMQGGLRQDWLIRETPVNGLAFELTEHLLAASTDGGGLRIWDLDSPNALYTSLGIGNIGTPVFLDAGRIAALTDDGVSLWRVETKALAEAACATAPSNLPTDDWTTYVGADLSRYELTCPGDGIGPHPSLLSHADSLASQGDEGAQAFYDLVNTLSRKTVVKNPLQRARGQRLYRELSELTATDPIELALAPAAEYNALRPATGLPSLPFPLLTRLCRQGVLLGETRAAVELCGGALELLRGDGAVLDARGLARALLGDLKGARADFVAARDWLEDPDWRARHQRWIDTLDAGRSPVLEVLQQIAHEERRASAPAPRPGLVARQTDVR